MPRLARWFPHLSVLSLVVLLCTALPVSPALASRKENRLVTDLVAQFDKGVLRRTSVGPDTTTTPNDGSLELSPVGYIPNWEQSAFTLPERLSDMGAVTVNGRIYLLGGTVFDQNANTKKPTAHVWVATPSANGDLSGATGTASGWTALSDLPAVPPSGTPGTASPCAQTTSPTSARSSVAAAGFGTGTGGFIYAVGGALAPATGDPYSTSAVAIGKVAADGSVTWSSPAGACLPTMVQASSATIVEINGEKYLYVVGGLLRQPPRGPLQIVQNGIKTTFFARINETTGDLSRFSDGAPGWDTDFDVPVPDTDPNREEGVWNATLVTASGTVNATTYFALYLMGGENIPGSSESSDSASVYRGIIDPATKKVSWNSDIGNGVFSAALNTARSGTRAIIYDGANIIVTGGKQGSTDSGAFNSVLSNQIDDKMELPVFGDSTLNFYESTNVLPSGRGRYNHGAVVVNVGTNKYVYVLGGIGNASANEGDQTDSVFYGKISTDPNASAGYALNGWYYSDTYQIDLDKAKLLAVRWTTDIDRAAGAMDIAIEYRINNDINKLNENWSDWLPATDVNAGDTNQSKSGTNVQNSSELPQGQPFIFFEYRAFFTTHRPADDNWQTPTLHNLGIEVEVPGWPNLQIGTAQQLTEGSTPKGLKITVINQKPLPAGNVLQPADDGSNGQFFVDVYIFKPGETAQPPTLGQIGQVYAKLNKRDFPAGASQDVLHWLDGAPGAGTSEYDITKLYTVPGEYTIYIMVDSVDNATLATNPFGLVQEADVAGQDGESDNLYGPLKFTVQTVCPDGCGLPVDVPPTTPRILMPVMSKG